MTAMKDIEWDQVKAIFEAALQRPPSERSAYLHQTCGDDKDLLQELATLLESHENAGDFIERPAIGDVAGEIENETARLRVIKNLGHYEIVRQIGAGGMGEVYLAKDKKLNRQVAIKILNASFSRHESNLQRFIKEARSASSLNHPNILVIHEIGEDAGTNFIVSEFVEGRTLREIIKAETPDLKGILEIAIQTVNALTAAHTAHLVHRDIKPENIMVRPDGLVKILDFGLAKLIERKNKAFPGLDESTVRQNETAKGIILGTVNYMSPEQAKGEKVDERTDIFSFGVVLYEMIAGKAPFTGDSMSETFANLINKDPQPLARLTTNVPDELERIVGKTLRKNKDERYQSARDLLTDLKELSETLTFKEKLGRSSDLSGENKTQAIRVNTADLNEGVRQTGQISRIISTRRRQIFASLLLIFLVGIAFFVVRRRQAASEPPEIRSLAVLPLKSLDANDNYLGLGIADAVIRRINQTGEMTVRPTSAVRHYLNEDTDALTAAKQLQTDAVLEGSVQRSDNRLRISVNLLRAADGASLWTDSFDLPATDIFTIQDKVAQQVASKLQLELSADQQARLNKRATSNPVAYDYYLRGIYAFDQRGYGTDAESQIETTIDLFRKAIDADPNFALAHAYLGYAYIWQAVFIDLQQTSADRAAEEFDRAQALDSQLAETHIARFLLLVSAYGNWQLEAGARELLAAQQLNPNVGHTELVALYFHLGLDDLTERELRRSLEIDPTSSNAKETILSSYSNLNKYDEWYAACQKYTPNNCDNSAWYLIGKGRLDEAQKALDATPVNPNTQNYRYFLQGKARLLALKGDFAAAEALIPDIIKSYSLNDWAYHHMTYDVACIYALAGNSTEAVKWLRETADKGFPCYSLFQRDQYLNHIRQSSEFIKFMEEQKAQNEKFRGEFQ